MTTLTTSPRLSVSLHSYFIPFIVASLYNPLAYVNLETNPSMIGAGNITENGTIGTSPPKQDILTTEKIEQLTANNIRELINSTFSQFHC